MEAETKTCCITGHRDIPAEKKEFVEEELRKEWQRRLRMAILDLFPVLPKVPILCLRQSLPKQKKKMTACF